MNAEPGGNVSRNLFLYVLGIYVVIPILIFLVTSVIFLYRKKFNPCKKSPSYYLWILILAYCCIFGSMSILRYFSFRTSIFDLGIFDHFIWNIANRGKLNYLSLGHFRPILGFFSLFYKFSPSAITLLVTQTVCIALSAVPLYYFAKDKLKSTYYALLIVLIFFLYSPVEYNNLFDFHTDHLIILLMFLAFYFLEKKKPLYFLLVCLPGLFLKEPLILSVAMMGAFAMIYHKMYKSGGFLLIGGLIFFFLVINLIIPYVSGTQYYGVLSNKGAFSYLGEDIFQIIKTIFSHPLLVLKEIINVWKIGYLIFIFLPLMFIPFLSPLCLLPAIPALVISLLSRSPSHYVIHHHYTASVIPAIFVSFVYGVKFLSQKTPWINIYLGKILKINLTKDKMVKNILLTVLIISLYYNVVLSPSPISIFFWKKTEMARYYRSSYLVTQRDKILNDAIKKFIPPDASVCSQNSINNSYLAHRDNYYWFPKKLNEVNYVVLDEKRKHFINDKVNEKIYQEKLNYLLKNSQNLFSYDGIYIFKL